MRLCECVASSQSQVQDHTQCLGQDGVRRAGTVPPVDEGGVRSLGPFHIQGCGSFHQFTSPSPPGLPTYNLVLPLCITIPNPRPRGNTTDEFHDTNATDLHGGG